MSHRHTALLQMQTCHWVAPSRSNLLSKCKGFDLLTASLLASSGSPSAFELSSSYSRCKRLSKGVAQGHPHFCWASDASRHLPLLQGGPLAWHRRLWSKTRPDGCPCHSWLLSFRPTGSSMIDLLHYYLHLTTHLSENPNQHMPTDDTQRTRGVALCGK